MEKLGPVRTRAATRREPITPARRQVLDLLADSPGGATVVDVARALDVHPNTAREHLEALVHAGRCVRAQMPAVGRGRPPMIYRIAPATDDVGPEYRVLAEVLVDVFAAQRPDPEEQRVLAERAGEQWVARLDDDERRRVLLAAIFDPEPVPGTVPAPDVPATVAFRLRRCPVLPLARRRPEIVCAVHRGLLRGAANGNVALQPFAEPGACLLRLAASEAPADGAAEVPGLTEDMMVAAHALLDALEEAVGPPA